MGNSITTGKVRFSYVSVFAPRKADKDNDVEKYSVTLLIPKQDQATYQAIMAGIEEAKQEGMRSVFGGSVPPILATPIHDGDGVKETTGEPYGPECRGHWVLAASDKSQPAIVDINVQPILQQALVYSGCYGRASLRFYPYAKGKKGIGCGLSGIQKLEDGEPLGGGISPEEAFGGSNTYGATQTQGAYPNAPAPGYGAPAGGYQQPAAPQYQPGAYQTPAPAYQSPVAPAPQYQTPPYQQSVAAPQYQAPQYQQTPYQAPVPQGYPQPAVDPVTGRPMAGGVMGI